MNQFNKVSTIDNIHLYILPFFASWVGPWRSSSSCRADPPEVQPEHALDSSFYFLWIHGVRLVPCVQCFHVVIFVSEIFFYLNQQTYKRLLVRFRNINAYGSWINCEKIGTLNNKMLFRRNGVNYNNNNKIHINPVFLIKVIFFGGHKEKYCKILKRLLYNMNKLLMFFRQNFFCLTCCLVNYNTILLSQNLPYEL